MATASCLKACAGPQDPSASPDRAQLHCCDADRSIWGCRCSISDFDSEPLAAHVSASSRRGIVAALLLAPLMSRRQAHEGHDHGPSEAVAGQLAPRVAARSETYELVGILRGERLVIYLDRFATNEPVTTADIAVTIGDAAEPVNAEWARGRDLRADVAAFLDRGTDRAGVLDHRRGRRDLLAGTLTVPRTPPRRQARPRSARCGPG